MSRPRAETMPGGHRAAETERVADRDHPVANPRRLRGEAHIGEVAALSLQEREVRLAVDADHLGRHRLAVGGRDGHFGGVVDDMVVGDDVAVGRDEEPGPLRLRQMMARQAVAVVVVIARHAEVAEEIIERAVARDIRQIRAALPILVVDRVGVGHLDLDRDDGRLHAVDNVCERGGTRCGPARTLRPRRRERASSRTRRRRGRPARRRREAPHEGNTRYEPTASRAPEIQPQCRRPSPPASGRRLCRKTPEQRDGANMKAC